MESTVRNVSDIATQIFVEGARELLGVEQWSRFASGSHAAGAPNRTVAGILTHSLEKHYGHSVGQGLALRIGRAVFRHGLKQLGDQAGFRTTEYRMLPAPRRVETGLHNLARVIAEYTGSEITISDEGNCWKWQVDNCQVCQGYSASEPCCYVLVGLIQEFTGWADAGRYYQVKEIACRAAGAGACVFQINKQPLDCG